MLYYVLYCMILYFCIIYYTISCDIRHYYVLHTVSYHFKQIFCHLTFYCSISCCSYCVVWYCLVFAYMCIYIYLLFGVWVWEPSLEQPLHQQRLFAPQGQRTRRSSWPKSAARPGHPIRKFLHEPFFSKTCFVERLCLPCSPHGNLTAL